jgi:glycosyltransferase involved in cell wall biosynthesis
MTPDVAVLIPARDAAATLPGLLEELHAHVGELPVLVVDDGSRDDTAQLARHGGAECFQHLSPQGKGAALRRGWDLLFRRGHGAVLCLDADGQHNPAEAPAMLDLWRREKPDLIIGDRDLRHAAMAWDRRLSNRLSTRILSLRSGLPLSDSQCGYRLLAFSLWERLQPNGRAFDLESEVLLQAGSLGARVCQIPVVQRPSGAGSHVKRMRDTGRFLRLLLGPTRLEGSKTGE